MKLQSKWTKEGWEKALRKVAGHLESLEDNILFFILARMQYSANDAAYERGKSCCKAHKNRSLLEIRLRQHEVIDATAGRYTIPEEVPFTRNIPNPERNLEMPKADRICGVELEAGNRVRLSEGIFFDYLRWIRDACEPGDDRQYGSCTEKDIPALRALSERVHYGAMYVAECKFWICRKDFTRMIESMDTGAILDKLTRPEVEANILERVKQKLVYFQKCASPDVRRLIDPESAVDFYRDSIIPLTKKGESIYLLQKKL